MNVEINRVELLQVKKMARRKKTERGYGEDAEYKVLHLKV
jgi:hypothetical protein